MPRVIEVIESQVHRGSDQSEDDPVRIVTQYYTKDGEFLAENDPCATSEDNAQ